MERARVGVAGVVIAALTLSACGGGGGGGTIPGGTEVPRTAFTKWSDNVAGKMIEAKGFGREIGYTYECTTDCLKSGRVKSITSDAPIPGGVTALFGFNEGGDLTYFTPTTALTQGFANTTRIPALTEDPNFVIGISSTTQAIVSNPKSFDKWNYQSFGVWESLDSDTSGTYGVMSVGTPTAASAIPAMENAKFEGGLVGAYVNSAGQGFAVLADVTVWANFSNGSGSWNFSTSNTQISSDWQNFGPPSVNLTLAGTFQYDAGTNTFISSDLKTGTNQLKGGGAGTFYGPGAVELGGVFSVRSTDSDSVETYAGAFGATKTTAP